MRGLGFKSGGKAEALRGLKRPRPCLQSPVLSLLNSKSPRVIFGGAARVTLGLCKPSTGGYSSRVCKLTRVRGSFKRGSVSAQRRYGITEIIVLFKAYCDGGNNPSDEKHRWITLAAIFSDRWSLKRFTSDWKTVLAKHSVEYLHTNKAIFDGKHDLLWDCANVISEHIVAGNSFRGIIPVTVTIDARDFTRQAQTPGNPRVLSEVLASQLLDRIIMGGREIAFRKGEDPKKVFYEFFFDRGEPYRGHILDRVEHPVFKRTTLKVSGIDIGRYFQVNAPLDSKDFAELQAADLFAWCYNHRHRIQFEWHYRMMDVRSDSVLLDHDALSKPSQQTVNFIESLKLPKRRIGPKRK
jgi:hypothetical protein